MAESLQNTLLVCKRCSRFLRTDEERQRGYCALCPLASDASAAQDEEIFCCHSDPPCPACPYVIGW